MQIRPKATLLEQCHEDKTKISKGIHIHAMCAHPYINKLHYAFHTDRLSMTVTDLSSCGDLARALRFTFNGLFSPDRVVFYAAEMASALLHLHKFGLVFYDLNPSNILLRSSGHISLADMSSVAGSF